MKIGLTAVFFLSLLVGLIFPQKIFAAVLINEFNPTVSPEWVEFYNPETVDISGYWIDDDLNFASDSGNAVKKKLVSLFGDDPIYRYVELTNFLNNSGDDVVLFADDGQVVDQYHYSNNPGENISLGRSPDGTDNWVVLPTSTMGLPNVVISPTPTPTPTSTPILTPSATPTPKATYKINEVKNADGDILSSVQIYVDNNYIHHYAPETIIFCDDCDYHFGSHIITLQKTNYSNWSESRAINSGNNFEVNPVLQVLPTQTPTPRPSPTPTPTPNPTPALTPKPTVSPMPTQLPALSPSLTPTIFLEEVLGTESAEVKTESNTVLPSIMISAGGMITFLGVLSFVVVKYKNGL